MLAEFSAPQLGALAALVYFAGVVDALAGGGGLITLPAYLSVGLNPALVLGTNKLASSIGTVASVLNYQRRQKLPLKRFWPVVLIALAGSFFGARLATLIDPSFIRILLLAVIPTVGALIYSRRDFGELDRSDELHPKGFFWRAAAVSLPIGAYDGFFGPGTGTFFALALVRWCRLDLLSATGRAKLLNLATNVSALAAFLLAGRVHLALGLSMGVLSIAGHWTGSHLGLKNGARTIRPAILFVCGGLFVKLLIDVSR